jgi:hypothetical protein
MNITEKRTYRCSYHPKTLGGHPIVSDSGVLPFVQLKAAGAAQAAELAHSVTGCAIDDVARLEPAEVAA